MASKSSTKSKNDESTGESEAPVESGADEVAVTTALRAVTELPAQVTSVRERWSAPALETLRANPGVAYEIATGPKKLMLSRAGYLRKQADLDVRTVAGNEGETITIYAQADGSYVAPEKDEAPASDGE